MKIEKVISNYEKLLEVIMTVENAKPCAPKNTSVALKRLEEIKKSFEEEIIDSLPIHHKDGPRKAVMLRWRGISLGKFVGFLSEHLQFALEYKAPCLEFLNAYLEFDIVKGPLKDKMNVLVSYLENGVEMERPEKLWSKNTSKK